MITVTGAMVMFVIFWWLSLFVVLPIGVHGQFEDGSTIEGTEEGAPKDAMIKKKMLWATYGAIGLTAGLAVLTYIFDFQALFLEG